VDLSFIKKVDEGLFGVTKLAWVAQLEANVENVSAPYYHGGLELCGHVVAGHTVMGDGGGCVCAVVESGRDYAAALIIVSHAKAKSEVRMLDIYVQPDLNLADAEPDYPALAWIAAKAIIGCLDLTYATYPAQQMKLHTAFPLDKEFMTAVTTALLGVGEYSKHYEISSQGNWIVVRKKAPLGGAHLVAVS